MKAILLLTVFFLSACSIRTPQTISEGGPCKYKKYEGRAKIESITQKPKPPSYSHEIFESDQEITENFARAEGKKFVLLLNNSEYPGSKFLKKYNIRVGEIFECYMKVITKGTCTPVIFEFPTIKLDDYFEK
jgi:hypothetical protein